MLALIFEVILIGNFVKRILLAVFERNSARTISGAVASIVQKQLRQSGGTNTGPAKKTDNIGKLVQPAKGSI